MKAIPGKLGEIMAAKADEVAAAKRQASEVSLLARATEQTPPRGFARALLERVGQGEGQEGVAVIAEVKRASPSKGAIWPQGRPFAAGAVARAYEEHGATCISCLTDRLYFQGDAAFVAEIRAVCGLPVLRKDFLCDPYQVIEARAMGADAVLLIMAVLSVRQGRELEAAARELGMDVLVEVHDERELEDAHELKTPLLGINNRNLSTFVTDLETSLRLAGRVEGGRLPVSESGIHTPADLRRLRDGGIHAFLVGEALMRRGEPGPALAALLA